jgi:uncharacterized protein YjbI with pentapeptide repeats
VDRQQQSRLRPTRRQLLWVGSIVGVVGLLFLIYLGYFYPWTGFGKVRASQGVQPAKTLWDWLGLLVVPAVLAAGGYLFTRAESSSTREATEQRSQDEALQAYLDQMGQMLLDEDRPLRQSEEGEEVRSLARARTLTVLSRLDGERKGTVVRFLYESSLIGRIKDPVGREKDNGIVDLRDADLSGSVLPGAVLSGVELKGVTLNRANLRGASLSSADLRGSSFYGANLSGAYLLLGTNLGGLESAATETYPPVDRMLRVDLRNANMKKAVMVGATLPGADLRGADLTGADLVHPRAGPYGILAEIKGGFHGREEAAKVLLEFFAGGWRFPSNQSRLRGTTLPDGQRYEAWLKAPGTDDVLRRLAEARKTYDPEVWRRRLGGGDFS